MSSPAMATEVKKNVSRIWTLAPGVMIGILSFLGGSYWTWWLVQRVFELADGRTP